MRQIFYLPQFRKEFLCLSVETRADFANLFNKYLRGEKLSKIQFKTFAIEKGIKIQEFKVKNDEGNWRAVSFILSKEKLVFVYAFHKKSQKLSSKDKRVIIKRIKEVRLGKTY